MFAAEVIEFFVPGIPMPKGSKTAIVRGKRAVLLDGRRGPARDAYDAWKASLAARALEFARSHPLAVIPGRDVAVAVDLTFSLPRPAAARRRAHPSRRPDLDKLVRAVLDGIAPAALFYDDSRVVDLVARKAYAVDGATGVRVRIDAI